MKNSFCLAAVLATFVSLMACSEAQAQQQAGNARKASAVAAQPVLKASVAEECEGDCRNAASSLSAPEGGGPLDYECAGGNCSCAGAADCVDMKKICAPGTIGCNDYGCTCAEAEDPEGDGG
jgi:hypothetical protein